MRAKINMDLMAILIIKGMSEDFMKDLGLENLTDEFKVETSDKEENAVKVVGKSFKNGADILLHTSGLIFLD